MAKRTALMLAILLGLAFGSAAETASADEYYFAMVFGSQSHPKRLKYTHTWATFIRAVGEGPDLNTYALQVHTISWLPQTLDIHVLRPWPEPGVNLDLYQTLQVVAQSGQSVTMWGPFVINKQIYDRSLFIYQLANSGTPQYRAISTDNEMLIADCIHAVAAADPIFGRDHYPLVRIGKPASRFIAREIVTRSPVEQAAYDNSWLIPRLGLDRYAIEVVPPQQIPKRKCFFCRCPE